MKYDIFISYKRKGTSSATAAYLYELLQQKGYNVFFDRKEMRSGKFNEQILEHISNATDILILLEQESLGSWFDYRTVKKSRTLGNKDSSGRLDPGIGFQEEPYKTDWFCKEIMHALSLSEKNIIPILLDGYKMPERKDLPPEMADLSDHQALNLDVSETEEFYEKYLIGKDYLKSKPANLSLTKRFQSKGGIVACFLLYTDADSCDLYECGEKIATLTDNDDEWHPFRYPVSFAGEHRFRAIHNDSCEIVTIRCSVETNCQQYVRVQFSDTQNLWQLTKEVIAAQDDAERLYNWGRGLFNGTIKHEPDVALSLDCLQRAIDLGSQDALSLVASYGSGLVTQKHVSDEVAFRWYTIAAEQGNLDALRNLGDMYRAGKGVEEDYRAAFECYRKCAEQGDSTGQWLLADMFESGWGVAKDYGKAVEWYRKSAEQGNVDGQFYLALMYKRGLGVAQDYRAAIEWYEKAAEQGDVASQFDLARLFEEGEGVDKDDGMAFKWYLKAAEQGDDDAQFCVGYHYEDGLGVEKDYGKSFEWYRKSAEQGHSSAQFKVGYYYENGLGVEQDYGKAFEWNEKSAQQGNPVGQLLLGNMYFFGHGVEEDYVKAFEWYQKSAEKGNEESQWILGSMFEEGQGVEKDCGKAFDWYTKSANQGNATAQYRLGDLYLDGLGVEQDYQKALDWYKKAAEQEYEESFNQIAWTYHLMGKDAEALPWAEKAVDAMPDDPNCVDTLATVYENFGCYDEAMAQFKKCLQMYKKSGEDEGIQRTSESIKSLKKKMAAGKK